MLLLCWCWALFCLAWARVMRDTRPGFRFLLLLPLLFSGASFGFFFAWQASTIGGLNAIAPGVAIEAMQAMNASVRNPAFAVMYFGTPVVLALSAVIALMWSRTIALLLGAALLVHLGGIAFTTAWINVPLNMALATADPASPDATTIWADYAAPWHRANLLRTITGGVSLTLVGLALLAGPRK